jgi:hypothetical protein
VQKHERQIQRNSTHLNFGNIAKLEEISKKLNQLLTSVHAEVQSTDDQQQA